MKTQQTLSKLHHEPPARKRLKTWQIKPCRELKVR